MATVKAAATSKHFCKRIKANGGSQFVTVICALYRRGHADYEVQNIKFALQYPEIPRTEEASSEMRTSDDATRIKWNVRIGE